MSKGRRKREVAQKGFELVERERVKKTARDRVSSKKKKEEREKELQRLYEELS